MPPKLPELLQCLRSPARIREKDRILTPEERHVRRQTNGLGVRAQRPLAQHRRLFERGLGAEGVRARNSALPERLTGRVQWGVQLP